MTLCIIRPQVDLHLLPPPAPPSSCFLFPVSFLLHTPLFQYSITPPPHPQSPGHYLSRPLSAQGGPFGIELVSKPQIRFTGKAQADEKTEYTLRVCEYFSSACNAASGPQ